MLQAISKICNPNLDLNYMDAVYMIYDGPVWLILCYIGCMPR